MWILVAVRGEDLCHLPKSTGLLLTLEGEVKAVLGHFSALSVLSAASTEAVFSFFPYLIKINNTVFTIGNCELPSCVPQIWSR